MARGTVLGDGHVPEEEIKQGPALTVYIVQSRLVSIEWHKWQKLQLWWGLQWVGTQGYKNPYWDGQGKLFWGGVFRAELYGWVE